MHSCHCHEASPLVRTATTKQRGLLLCDSIGGSKSAKLPRLEEAGGTGTSSSTKAANTGDGEDAEVPLEQQQHQQEAAENVEEGTMDF